MFVSLIYGLLFRSKFFKIWANLNDKSNFSAKITYFRTITISFNVITLLCYPDIIKAGLLMYQL